MMLEITEVKQMELTDYMDIKMEIKKNLTGIVSSFNVVGFYLKHIKERKLYVEEGYKDVWEFAYSEFKLDRTAAGRFMRINDRYSVDGNSLELQEQYKGFSKSTLTEMLSLPEEDYELITEDTKISDIRELKKAEEEQSKEQEQIPGQASIISMMPNVVPNTDKPVEVDIKEAIRDIFKPRERKEQLDTLVNMDPDSVTMAYWVEDFNNSGNLMLRKIPYFMFFYPLKEGMKIKNVKTGEIKSYTYKDFYFMVRAAFHQETVKGRDVWNQAFGAEYEAEQQRIKEEEAQKKTEEQRKKEIQKQREERQRAIKENQEKSAVTESQTEVSEQKEDEIAAALKEIKENSDSENNLKCSECEYYYKESDAPDETIDCHYKPGEENGWNEIPPCERKEKVGIETEASEIVTGTVEQEEEESVCDIAQNKKAFRPTSKIIERMEELGLLKSVYKDVEVGYDTYCNILEHGQRYLIEPDGSYCGGDRLNIICDDYPPIKAIVLNYRAIPHKNAGHVYGFEVESYGQEE